MITESSVLLQGFTLNPSGSSPLTTIGKRRQLHVNAGLSQLHCLFNEYDGTPCKAPQTLNGRIGLDCESIDAVERRLLEGNIAFKVEQAAGGERRLEVVGPNNNVFSLGQTALTRAQVSGMGEHDGGLGEVLCMPFVELQCQPGTAQGLAEFYREFFGVAVTHLESSSESSIGASCRISIGESIGESLGGETALQQELRFVETPTAPSREDYEERVSAAYHIALYVGEADFRLAYDKFAARGLVWVNPRFVEDSAANWEEAAMQQQFRIRDVVDPGGGQLLLMLEHEVRSTAHPCCPLR